MTRPAAFDPASVRLSSLPRRLVPFVLGYEPIPEAISLRGGDPSRYLLEPVTAAAVVYDDGWVLLDTGFNVDIVRDPERRAAHFNYDSYTAVVPPGDPLLDEVAEAGLDWADLRLCAVSHMHLDHTGGLRLVPDGVPILFQELEWSWLESGAGVRQTVVPSDMLDRTDDIRLLDGDVLVAPGLTALDTRGHTPGHQSFRVDFVGSSIVLACDAADLRANIDRRLPCGWTAVPEDAPNAQASIERLAALEGPGVEVWPGHDPEWGGWLRS